jgi:sec-independent protein translocase protein TatA
MNHFLLFGNIGAGEVILIALVILLLFGGKKIPELMKGIGKGVKSFKDGMNGIGEQINSDDVKSNSIEVEKKEGEKNEKEEQNK